MMRKAGWKWIFYAVGAAALAGVGPIEDRNTGASGAPLARLQAPADCVASSAANDWKPQFDGPDDLQTGAFECADNSAVDVFCALWRVQREGKEAVGEENRFIPAEWRFISTSSSVPTQSGFDATETVVNFEGSPLVIWTWYAIGAAPAADGLEAKAREVINAVLFKRAPTAAFVVGVRAATPEVARRVLREQADVLWQQYLRSQSVA